MKNIKRICFVTTISGTIRAFLLDFAFYLVDNRGYDVTFICNNDETMYSYTNDYIHYIPISIKRGIGFDGLSVVNQLNKIFREYKFDLVQYATPNASFYASIAAKKAGVKNRLYTHWGSRYMGCEGGLGRMIFKTLEKITCKNSSVIETESFSLLDYSIKDGLYSKDKASVIWNGSACGVRLENYDLSQREKWRKETRSKYNIPENCVVFGWCGRITRDKGHNELFVAFKELIRNHNNARLLMVGSYDNVETIDPDLFKWAKNCDKVIFTGPVPGAKVPEMYSAMDVFCSLSYREGFGLVVIEAAAMKLPAIVTNVPGQLDTVVDGRTGLLVPAKKTSPVVEAMEYYLNNPDKLIVMGKDARREVEEKYEQYHLFELLADHRDNIING